MLVIRGRNVHQILPEALYQLGDRGVTRDSRNGPVMVFPEPVTTVYEKPAERVMFWPEREANPFFHLLESLWMLNGMNDVETVAKIVENMRNYSDNGTTFHGAYGHRWRHWFGFDQLRLIITNLRDNPEDRRQVLSMWDAREDLLPGDIMPPRKDLPCNLQATFQVNMHDELDMMVTNRSNDMVWGAYGANAVHFSYLHEFIATAIGVPQGKYFQVSANFHTYSNVLGKVENLVKYARDPLTENPEIPYPDPYERGLVEPFPLMSIPYDDWLIELKMFFDDPEAMGFRDPFFRRVAVPMAQALACFKDKTDPNRFANARECLKRVRATDWRLAAEEWIYRREANDAKKQNQ